MPIERQPEIKKAKSKAELVKRFTAAEDRAKEAIGRAQNIEKRLNDALNRIETLERRQKMLDQKLEIIEETVGGEADKNDNRIRFIKLSLITILGMIAIISLRSRGIL